MFDTPRRLVDNHDGVGNGIKEIFNVFFDLRVGAETFDPDALSQRARKQYPGFALTRVEIKTVFESSGKILRRVGLSDRTIVYKHARFGIFFAK
jgi:DNA-binding NarL/FixJ family response regulator